MFFIKNSKFLALPMAMSVVMLSACSTLGIGDEVIDYKATQKAKALDIPPELTTVVPPPRDFDNVRLSEVNRAVERTQSGAISVEVSKPTSARIVDAGIYRYLETTLPASELWDRLGKYFSSIGLAVAQSNADLGVMYTEWQENRANQPSSKLRDYIAKAFPGVASTGRVDRYQAFVEKHGETNRVYISHYGLHETERPGLKDSFYWAYRPKEPILELEILKQLAIFLDVKEPQVFNQNQTNSVKIAEVKSANEIIINSPLATAREKLLVALPNNGFILNGSSGKNQIEVIPQIPLSYPPDKKSTEQFLPYQITINENGGSSTAIFEYKGDNRKLASTDISQSLEKLVNALNF